MTAWADPDPRSRVRVCRDCCCGTVRKHPGVDHDGLLDRLRARVAGAGAVSVSACLLACERSDVVVVSPAPAARRVGARPVWLAEVLDAAAVDAVAAWVRAGGPGLAAVPAGLDAHLMEPPALACADPAALGSDPPASEPLGYEAAG